MPVKKKKANTNLKTWIKPKNPDPHCMRPGQEGVLMGDGADKGGGVYTVNSLYYRRLAV